MADTQEGYDARWHARIERDLEGLAVGKVDAQVFNLQVLHDAREREAMRKDVDANRQTMADFLAEQSRNRRIAIGQIVTSILSLVGLVIAAIALVVTL